MNSTNLTTERLILRQFKETDWQAVHEYASDPEVVRYLSWGPNTEEDTRDFVGRAIARHLEQPRQNYEFAMVLKAEDKLVGHCGIGMSDASHHTEAWIYYFLNRSYWGRGYATEAVHALLEFGFFQLKLHRIFATCDPENSISASVLQKVGMQREGCLRQHELIRGEWRDSLLYAILKDEWRQRTTVHTK